MTKGIKGFQKGHKSGMTGHKHSSETILKMSDTHKKIEHKPQQGFQKGHTLQLGENHWGYKGDMAKKMAIHDWIKKRYGFPPKCEHCGKESENHYQIQWANKDHKYSRNRDDWMRLCVSCHMKLDKHSEKIWESRRRNGTEM